MNKKLLITTPIYYINAAPHIGSVTTCVIADFFKRIYSIRGYDVYLTTGTDENGQKIQKSNCSSLSLEEFKYQNATLFQSTFDAFDISYDRFIRTTETEHHHMVIRIWNLLKKLGHIYEGNYRGYYCVSDETFYTEKDLVKKDGSYYTKDHKLAEYIERPAYFLRLDNMKEYMLNFYKTHPNITYPFNRVNELSAFIEDGFRDLCISREDNIGVIIPDSKYTVYVWFDALINYLTVAQCEIDENNPQFPLKHKGYWGNVIHLVGKDILTFHGLFWIAILGLANLIPENITVFTHNWWVFFKGNEVEKMSKSLGNVISPSDLCDKYGVDCVRFYILFVNLINNDMQFNEEQMLSLFNSYIVNKFSNLVYRVFSLLRKKGIRCDEMRANSKYENVLLSCEMDINLYMKTLFEWCDTLNEFVDKNTIWNNLNAAVVVAEEINQLYKYFEPIVPSIGDKFANRYEKPIFMHIK